jgi:hypothetical protein
VSPRPWGEPIVSLAPYQAPRVETMHWYRIEVWNNKTEEWENPCTPRAGIPVPRVLAIDPGLCQFVLRPPIDSAISVSR